MIDSTVPVPHCRVRSINVELRETDLPRQGYLAVAQRRAFNSPCDVQLPTSGTWMTQRARRLHFSSALLDFTPTVAVELNAKRVPPVFESFFDAARIRRPPTVEL